ncbi:hypothetical protein [Pantoea ananatis]|uniref:hypothetical protein n=1 Tax=Pantoea ananas TaxID=553 RepID=UPI0023AF1273|nr:hypothetical protein [Pantoea ananatis]
MFANQLGHIAKTRHWPLLSTSAHPGHTRTNLQTSGPNLGTASTRKKLMYYLVPSVRVEWATESLLRAAVDPSATQGEFYGPRFLLFGAPHVAKQPKTVMKSDPTRLWQTAEALTGILTPAA